MNIPDKAREYAPTHKWSQPPAAFSEEIAKAFIAGAEWARKEADKRIAELESRLRADDELMNMAGLERADAEAALAKHDAEVRHQALLDAHALCTTTTDAAAISRLIEAERDLKETPHA